MRARARPARRCALSFARRRYLFAVDRETIGRGLEMSLTVASVRGLKLAFADRSKHTCG